MKKTLTIILILLAIHLLYTNSILLLRFVEHKTAINEIMRVIFAGSYSIITVLILSIYPKRYVFILAGLLDGFSVALSYDFNTIALFFGIYTAFIVIIAGEIKRKNELKTTSKENQNEPKEDKTKIIEDLRSKKRALQNSINRLKNQDEKITKQNELNQIQLQLIELTKP